MAARPEAAAGVVRAGGSGAWLVGGTGRDGVGLRAGGVGGVGVCTIRRLMGLLQGMAASSGLLGADRVNRLLGCFSYSVATVAPPSETRSERAGRAGPSRPCSSSNGGVRARQRDREIKRRGGEAFTYVGKISEMLAHATEIAADEALVDRLHEGLLVAELELVREILDDLGHEDDVALVGRSEREVGSDDAESLGRHERRANEAKEEEATDGRELRVGEWLGHSLVEELASSSDGTAVGEKWR